MCTAVYNSGLSDFFVCRIRFTVVSEPPDDDMDAECEDIGVAFVSVKEILMSKKDVEEQNVESE